MVLKADVAGLRSWPPIGIDGTGVLRGNWLPFGKIRDLDTIQKYDDVRSIHGDLHDVPFVERFDWTCQGFCECVEHAGAGIIVRPVADLNFITAIELNALIRKREIKPSEAVAHAIARVEALNRSLGAFCAMRADKAMAEARAMDERVGHFRLADETPQIRARSSVTPLRQHQQIRRSLFA